MWDCGYASFQLIFVRSRGRLRSTMIFVLAFLVLGLTCSMVHWLGFFSGRQRRNLVPWRKRPPEK